LGTIFMPASLSSRWKSGARDDRTDRGAQQVDGLGWLQEAGRLPVQQVEFGRVLQGREGHVDRAVPGLRYADRCGEFKP
jgi:hypothetical protein